MGCKDLALLRDTNPRCSVLRQTQLMATLLRGLSLADSDKEAPLLSPQMDLPVRCLELPCRIHWLRHLAALVRTQQQDKTTLMLCQDAIWSIPHQASEINRAVSL